MLFFATESKYFSASAEAPSAETSLLECKTDSPGFVSQI
jgi:hypothetical protein